MKAFIFEDVEKNKAVLEGFVFTDEQTDEEIEEARPMAMIIGMMLGCKLYDDVQQFHESDQRDALVTKIDIAGREVSLAFIEGPYFDENISKATKTEES